MCGTRECKFIIGACRYDELISASKFWPTRMTVRLWRTIRKCQRKHTVDRSTQLAVCGTSVHSRRITVVARRITYPDNGDSLATEVMWFDGGNHGWDNGFWDVIQRSSNFICASQTRKRDRGAIESTIGFRD
jgi:hypothetical protein